ncbi:glucose-fructose oxidoreductase [Natronococcus pandeyae]|uniref:Glucose-fructose oxidoreductase n=1 Tax=Natronococcus pandeyae TaxID=2055836 RepID=A0A8J8TQF2_9EURY|nr:Gfo/Idh/MocA family oxidoreductase [Natronococcus pandeyae]TYL38826.1 glucose-fructose oxidoreductase [Natronococcus pandeyae]
MEFGILSTAGIARKSVLPAIRASEHDVGAIASRDGDRARALADEFDVPRSYDSYDDLLGDSQLDAVYVPVPNALHAEWTKRAADAGVDILCEKPLAVDADEARDVAAYCEERDATLMEAFMYRYHPRTERAIELAREGLDDVRSVSASFKFALYGDPENVRLDEALAGGSLMDVGCYAVSAARQFLGEPDRAYAHTHDSRNAGVDTELAGILEYDDGSSARIASGLDTPKVQRYRVEGPNGWIEVEDAFDAPLEEPLELEYRIGGRHAVETFDPVDHYRLEVEHFARCVEEGVRPRTDAEEAIANMRVIDALSESAERGEPTEL